MNERPLKSRGELVRQHVYAVIRLDKFQARLEDAVTVKEILPSQEEARAEATRLNALRHEQGESDEIVYLVQTTRFFPNGIHSITRDSVGRKGIEPPQPKGG